MKIFLSFALFLVLGSGEPLMAFEDCSKSSSLDLFGRCVCSCYDYYKEQAKKGNVLAPEVLKLCIARCAKKYGNYIEDEVRQDVASPKALSLETATNASGSGGSMVALSGE